MFEASRDSGGAHDLVVCSKKGDFGSHAPFDASAGASDDFELVLERFGGFQDSLIVCFEELSHGGWEERFVSFANEIIGCSLQQLGICTICKNDDTLFIFYPKHNIGEGFEEPKSNLARLEFSREFCEARIGLSHELSDELGQKNDGLNHSH